jgi:DNA-binding HxlR family transcriptional regulator
MISNKENERRSDCPVNFAVELLGDKWSLLIIRDIIFWGKKTYGDFLKSDERPATNILASRLAFLEREGIIKRSKDSTDGRREIYGVTEKGLELIPTLIEMIAWSAKNESWQALEPKGNALQKRFVMRAATLKNRSGLIEEVRQTVLKGGYVFQPDQLRKNEIVME